MKRKILLPFLAIIILAGYQKPKSVNFDWLIGDWERENNPNGVITFEYWRKTNSSLYEGLGYSLKENDTFFKEILKLQKKSGYWDYTVIDVHEQPTHFRLNSIEKQFFTAKNPTNQFPKEITYQLQQDQLKAIITDERDSIEFIFKPSN